MEWISIVDKLPELFENVIVYGVREKENVCSQAYQARRWTGCTNGFDVEKEALWSWLTPCDSLVKEVSHWMPLTKPPIVFHKDFFQLLWKEI